MYPLVHPGVAYLCYVAILRIRGRHGPGDRAAVALVVGSILPDLIDQPLYRLADVPSTRTLGHSLLVAIPICFFVWVLIRRFDVPDRVAGAFAVGYGSHLAADAFWPVVLGLPLELGFLLWPITDSPPYVGQKPLGALAGRTVTTLWVELLILGTALLVWWRDGRPGWPGIGFR